MSTSENIIQKIQTKYNIPEKRLHNLKTKLIECETKNQTLNDEIIVDLLADQPIKSKSCGFYCLKYILTNKWERMKNFILIRKENGGYSIEFIDKFNSNKTLIRRNNEIFNSMIKS